MKKLFYSIFFLLSLSSQGQQIYTIDTPELIEDAALLDGEYASWNFGSSHLLEVGYMVGIYVEHNANSLIRFDVSSIPYQNIKSAKIRLYKPKCFVQQYPVEVSMYAVSSEYAQWVEGNDICVENGGVNWISQGNNRPWSD